jgi:hypothetical protein
VTFSFPTDCSATSPMLLLLLVHQGQIARPPCKLTKRRTTATTRHCLIFALPFCIDPASTVHWIFFCCFEIGRPTCKLTQRWTTAADPIAFWCVRYQSRLHLVFPHRDWAPAPASTRRHEPGP